MGWIIFDERLNESEFLLSTGKILFVCQHFEAICKDIVMSLCLAKALYEKQFEMMSDDHIEYVDRLHRLFLGESINRLKATFGQHFNNDDINTIAYAKNARNYVCHEMTLGLIFSPFGRQYHFAPDCIVLRSKLHDLAQGDYLVSRWSYEFHEKESGAFVDCDAYIKRIDERWVFADIISDTLE